MKTAEPKIETRPYLDASDVYKGDMEMLTNWAKRCGADRPIAMFWTPDNGVIAFDPESETELAAGLLVPESFSKPPYETHTIICGVLSNPDASPKLRTDGMKAVILELSKIATNNGYLAPLSVVTDSDSDESLLRANGPAQTSKHHGG